MRYVLVLKCIIYMRLFMCDNHMCVCVRAYAYDGDLKTFCELDPVENALNCGFECGMLLL